MTERFPIRRFENGEIAGLQDTLVTEAQVSIEVAGVELIQTTCSPGHMQEWVLGYLFSEGHIARPEDVAEIQESDGVFSVELTDSAPVAPAPLASVASKLTLVPAHLLDAARDVVARAEVFHRTGGTHAMAIVDERAAFASAFAEDISRTCALEKAIGLALQQRADFGRCLAFLSSRVPSRMLAKLVRCGIPIVAAVSAPTVDAVRLAEGLSVCLCGFVRSERMNVYTHGWRLGL
ncbi:formate dehydrogenase accessory sulfurtransferase FdhD [Candidatus Bipolaricaulota bacterium]